MQTLSAFLANIVEFIINPLIGFLFALALAFFVWGAAQFILNAADSEGRKKGKNALIWGLVGLFIMTGVFGILRIVVGTFAPEAVTF